MMTMRDLANAECHEANGDDDDALNGKRSSLLGAGCKGNGKKGASIRTSLGTGKGRWEPLARARARDTKRAHARARARKARASARSTLGLTGLTMSRSFR